MNKIWFILLLTLVGNRVSAQVSVSGKIRSFHNVGISLTDLEGKIRHQNDVESSKPFDSGTLPLTPDYYQLKVGNIQYLLWLEHKPVVIKGFVDDKNPGNSTVQITGNLLTDSSAMAEKEFKAAKGGWNLNAIKDKYSALILAGVIFRNIEFFSNKEEDLKFVQKGLLKSHPGTKIAEWLTSRVKRVDGFTKGATLPGFRLPDKNGKLYSGADFKGKLLLIDFWASWCGPCRAEMKSLHKIYEELKGDDLVFISISTDENRDKWLQAMTADAMPWLGLWNDKENTKLDLANMFGFQQIPFIILVNKEGKIVARHLRGEQVRNEILKYR